MFYPILKNNGPEKLVYATSLGFRLVFVVIMVFMLFVTNYANVLQLIFIVICILGATFLERFIFDRAENTFEVNIGLLFLYSTRKIKLDELKQIVLRESGIKETNKPWGRIISGQVISISVVDKTGKVFSIDRARGSRVRELREFAARISDFCDIPINDRE